MENYVLALCMLFSKTDGCNFTATVNYSFSSFFSIYVTPYLFFPYFVQMYNFTTYAMQLNELHEDQKSKVRHFLLFRKMAGKIRQLL